MSFVKNNHTDHEKPSISEYCFQEMCEEYNAIPTQ